VELQLVGRSPDPRVLALGTPGTVVTGTVPDMLPYLQAATAYVAPLTTGAGTRTKLLEAMAAALPIVTSSLGIEGIEAIPNREVIIADEPRSFVAAVERLLQHPEERRRLGRAARRLVETCYDWSRCLAPLEPLYTGLIPAEARPC
jgi:glycosyltransferase involved in cell wall biosynthesis